MKLSIVTINYNNAEGLERTIRSVEAQARSGFEYIVVDGGSDDGSGEIVARHGASIDKAIVGPDTGPFCAMNKGAGAASGEYLLFLNSGDSLARPDSLAPALPRLEGKDFYYADALFSSGRNERIHRFPDVLDFDFVFEGALNHQNTFVRRSYLSDMGGYDERFKIVSDWAFMVRAFYDGTPDYERLPFVVAKFELGGSSGKRSNQARVLDEKRRFLESMDPHIGGALAKYVEIIDGDYARACARFRHKNALAGIERALGLGMRLLVRMGL
jgi:glycosyltransferase involved in cell wall biosynthesis